MISPICYKGPATGKARVGSSAVALAITLERRPVRLLELLAQTHHV